MDTSGLARRERRMATGRPPARIRMSRQMFLQFGREEEKKRMSRKFAQSVILGCLLVLYTGIAGAQQAPPPPPPPAADMLQGGPEGEFPPPPFGERMELLGFGGMHGG